LGQRRIAQGIDRPITEGKIMTQNVGTIDRMIRIVAGLTLVTLAATGVLGAWAWLGLILLATGVVGYCMPYQWLGLNTCVTSKKTAE
jgi:hypothetical protein